MILSRRRFLEMAGAALLRPRVRLGPQHKAPFEPTFSLTARYNHLSSLVSSPPLMKHTYRWEWTRQAEAEVRRAARHYRLRECDPPGLSVGIRTETEVVGNDLDDTTFPILPCIVVSWYTPDLDGSAAAWYPQGRPWLRWGFKIAMTEELLPLTLVYVRAVIEFQDAVYQIYDRVIQRVTPPTTWQSAISMVFRCDRCGGCSFESLISLGDQRVSNDVALGPIDDGSGKSIFIRCQHCGRVRWETWREE